MDEQIRSRDGTTIAFDRSGHGPPVILVGGAFQHRLIDEAGAQLQARLAWDFTVFHYDRRGRGDSGDTPPYAVEREVEDLAALVHEAGGSPAVFGMSSGAALALEAAGRGLPISRLALYEPPFIVDGGGPPAPADLATRIREVVAEMRAGVAWPMLERVAHTLHYDTAIMRNQESLLNDIAPAITAPTLVIDGSASPAWARDATRALAARLPNAEHRTLEGQTHQAAPAALSPVLEEFFSQASDGQSHQAGLWQTASMLLPSGSSTNAP